MTCPRCHDASPTTIGIHPCPECRSVMLVLPFLGAYEVRQAREVDLTSREAAARRIRSAASSGDRPRGADLDLFPRCAACSGRGYHSTGALCTAPGCHYGQVLPAALVSA